MLNCLPNLSHYINPAYLAEWGTAFLLILFGSGVCANASLNKTKGNSGGYFMVVSGWAIGIALTVFLFSRASGAHGNPALTFALAIVGAFPWNQVCPYIIAQFLGTMAGAITVYLIYYPHFQESGKSDEKLAVFCTAPGIRSPFWNFFTEMAATAVLLFIITGLGYAARDGETMLFDPGFSAIAVGFVIIAIGLGLGGPTGFALNPARDFGPRLIYAFLPISDKRNSDWGYAWVPVAAPFIGAPIGAFCWRLLFGNATIPAMLF